MTILFCYISILFLELEDETIIIYDVALSIDIELFLFLIFNYFHDGILIINVLDLQFLGDAYVFICFDHFATDL